MKRAQPFSRPEGFTYIGLMIAIVLLGLALSAVGTVWRTTAQREREKELLFIGRAYATAIASYYAAGRQLPQELNDLVEDKRWPVPRHFLRRLYPDPMTGEADWTLIPNETSSGIKGIASSSAGVPIKKSGFSIDEDTFNDAQTYQDWQFVFVPRFGKRKINVNPVTSN